MLNNILALLNSLFEAMIVNAKLALLLTGLLGVIHLINFIVNYRLNQLGLSPRKIRGIPGIVFSPFLHGSFTHLFFNAMPFFILTDFMLLQGKYNFLYITGLIIIISGILLWLFGRRGIHVGVSGLIMGYMAFLLMNAWTHVSFKSIFLALICVYYLGGLLLGLLPREEKVSWEGHVFGFLAGALSLILSAK